MSHPNASKLDALALDEGPDDAATRAHVATCEECKMHMAELTLAMNEFRAQAKVDAPAFAEAVLAKAKAAPASRPSSKAKVLRLVAVVPAFAAAAAVLFYFAKGNAVSDARNDVELASPSAAGATHFKGELSVVAIRDRDGVQTRFAGPFAIRADDRVRLELAVDRERPLAAGLLFADGSWTPLLAPADLSAGAHLSELAARFDDSRTDATLLVGAPNDVTRARATHDFERVVAWQVRSEVDGE